MENKLDFQNKMQLSFKKISVENSTKNYVIKCISE